MVVAAFVFSCIALPSSLVALWFTYKQTGHAKIQADNSTVVTRAEAERSHRDREPSLRVRPNGETRPNDVDFCVTVTNHSPVAIADLRVEPISNRTGQRGIIGVIGDQGTAHAASLGPLEPGGSIPFVVKLAPKHVRDGIGIVRFIVEDTVYGEPWLIERELDMPYDVLDSIH